MKDDVGAMHSAVAPKSATPLQVVHRLEKQTGVTTTFCGEEGSYEPSFWFVSPDPMLPYRECKPGFRAPPWYTFRLGLEDAEGNELESAGFQINSAKFSQSTCHAVVDMIEFCHKFAKEVCIRLESCKECSREERRALAWEVW